MVTSYDNKVSNVNKLFIVCLIKQTETQELFGKWQEGSHVNFDDKIGMGMLHEETELLKVQAITLIVCHQS